MRRLPLRRWGRGFGCMGEAQTGSIASGWWRWRFGLAVISVRFREGMRCGGTIGVCLIGFWCGLPRRRRATCC